ncbi:MAG: Mth938-like domain-containing protein [Candidatus Aminicenantes bacterium]|nr:MAG: Mth938-like domain-containing protein [Candidatus Aminicenantes bacterium]
MIESYIFGRMEIRGQAYTSDLILFPDKINDSWWRVTGHKLSLQDIEDVFRENPEVLIIGTGFYGIMEVGEDVKEAAQSKGITLIIEKTENAVQRYNEIASEKKTIGAFHLTC